MGRTLTIDDVLNLRVVSDVQLSPAGDRVAFVRAESFKPHDEPAQSRVWVLDLPRGHAREFTSGPRSDKEPRWSPDGRRLAFTSDRNEKGKHQLFVIDVEAGEAQRIVDTPNKVTQPAWSPDGMSIAFIMTEPETEEEKKRNEDRNDHKVVDAAPKFDRLCVADVTQRTWRTVTQGASSVWEFEWSPDGSQFILLTAPRPGDDGWFDAELSVVPSSGGEPKQLIKTGKQFAAPRWSADGRKIAFITCLWSDPGLVGGDLFVLDTRTRSIRNLTMVHAVSVSWLHWKPDGSGLFFMGHTGGAVALYEVDIASSVANMLWRENVTFSERNQPKFSVNHNGDLFAVAREDPLQPRDIWTWSQTTGWVQHTHLHEEFDTISFGPTEDVEWLSRDQKKIHGLLVRPPGDEAKPPFPLIVQVHGGPANVWPHRLLAGWHDWGQLLAARGYAVFLPNFRGSFGWGTDFTAANLGDMGGGDFQDIMTGIDHLITAGVADPNRLGICGWSYGGFMSAWAVTQTDRFRAAIMGAAITNWMSFHGTAEIPTWDVLFWRDNPYRRDGRYLQFSPVMHAESAKTPTLILHGCNDRCVPLSQSKEFYRVLRDRKTPTELVIYPREGHSVQEKHHQRDLLNRVTEWFDRWLKDPKAANV